MLNKINVEVAFATPVKQIIKELYVEGNTSIVDIIRLSNINEDFLEFDLPNMPYGVFGKKIDNNYQVQDGDRIEIYRPLAKTPNQRRLERASK